MLRIATIIYQTRWAWSDEESSISISRFYKKEAGLQKWLQEPQMSQTLGLRFSLLPSNLIWFRCRIQYFSYTIDIYKNWNIFLAGYSTFYKTTFINNHYHYCSKSNEIQKLQRFEGQIQFNISELLLGIIKIYFRPLPSCDYIHSIFLSK